MLCTNTKEDERREVTRGLVLNAINCFGSKCRCNAMVNEVDGDEVYTYVAPWIDVMGYEVYTYMALWLDRCDGL